MDEKLKILVRGAKVHNLKNLNVDIPLGQMVAICGVSGSGKSSLALGTLYAEGSRRYLEALSTYTRRRISQVSRADFVEIKHLPAALALAQRPGIPGIRSTFGTSTELLNSLRLLFSRLGSHPCSKGHLNPPSLKVALMQPIKCQQCGEEFYGPSAEELAFNSQGACKTCQGTGQVLTVDEASLIPNASLSIEEGAVAPWQSLMWSIMKDVAREMGVRTHIPFKDLTAKEKEIVLHGPSEKRHILYVNEKTNVACEMDFTYFNATYTVENALAKVKDEKGLKRLEKFLKEDLCPDCKGSRLNEKAKASLLAGLNLARATQMSLRDLISWVKDLPKTLPSELHKMAESIIQSFLDNALRLMQLGLGYLTLDRASSSLSTGERQRVQLARSVRNETHGVLYVLDEPSIGLHPHNLEGLLAVIKSLVSTGNSVILVDHDLQVIKEAQHLIELGPLAGSQGGTIIAQGSLEEILATKSSVVAPYLAGQAKVLVRKRLDPSEIFALGSIQLETKALHTVKALKVAIPKSRLTVITGVSGSGKTTLVLECLIPGLLAKCQEKDLPSHLKSLNAPQIKRVNLIDASPIGLNIRSTVATYSGILDGLRKLYAKTSHAQAQK
ncbi:MAG: hypothetical protein IJU40_00400, partial [Desulfovibrionaceae bacterium]|nr:hypothetical protein [Desulfovibrionaceae bacterium]